MRTKIAIRNLIRALVLTLVVILALTSTTAVAQDPRGTIPERLAQAGHNTGTVYGVVGGTQGDPNSSEYLRRFTDRLLSDTDVIVRGTVGQPRVSSLSEDQMEVYTDYPIENPVFLYQADVVPSRAPGLMQTIAATLVGGTITINGLSFRSTHHTLEGLEPGTEYLFLLKRIGDRYLIPGKYLGVFRITGARLAPAAVGPGFPTAYRDVPAAKATEELVAQRRARLQ